MAGTSHASARAVARDHVSPGWGAAIIAGALTAAVFAGFRVDAPNRPLGARRAAPAPSATDERLVAVPLTAVTVTGGFWHTRLERNRTVTLPHIFRQNDETGRLANFLKAARRMSGPHVGRRYNDTDVYKAVEAASYALATTNDAALKAEVDRTVAAIAAAQEPDGYIYTARTIDPATPAPGAGPERWSRLHTSHELYDAGHLYEAAVAHYQATGSRTLLDVAIRNADLVCRVFGPNARKDAPGHQEVELALVKLARVTGDRKYLAQAQFFLEQRGRPKTQPPPVLPESDPFSIYNDTAYRQDHQPVLQQTRAIGHAVRATYMYSAMTDMATDLHDDRFGAAVDRLWDDVTGKRMYLTGGLGSQGRTEAFGDDYVLPNRRAYAETCAQIGGLLWHQRMFLRSGDAKFLDAFEQTLYNGYLSGVSQRGDTFFYQNPLESAGRVERSAYFDVACCPANLARLMAQLPGLIYATRRREVFVNHFIASRATIPLAGTSMTLAQETAYPWSGGVRLTIVTPAAGDVTLAIRIPGWARGRAFASDLYRDASPEPTAPTIRLNGGIIRAPVDGGFARITRRWAAGDLVEVDLPMRVRRVLADDRVEEDRGKAAIMRGPVVFAIEGVDNGGSALDVVLPIDAPLAADIDPTLFDGMPVVTGEGTRPDGARRTVRAIPYFAWANRGTGEMAVWIPTSARAAASMGDGNR